MTTVASSVEPPHAIPLIIKQVSQWPKAYRSQLIYELREKFEQSEIANDEEILESADPEDLLTAIWAELPEDGIDITDEELDGLKMKRRKEKFG